MVYRQVRRNAQLSCTYWRGTGLPPARWRRRSPFAGKRDLDIEDLVGSRRVFGLEDSEGHIMHRHATRRFAGGAAMMCVTVDDEICAVPVNDFSETGSAQVREDLGSFSLNG